MNNSLQIENLSMTFGKRDPVHALNNVNVSFPDCTISGLLGNNGAGKTTLIKCLVGLLTPNQGIIKMSSAPKVLDSNTRRKIISVVLDGGRNLFWYMTVRENIRYFLMLRKQPYDMQPVHPDRNPVHRNQVKTSPRRVHSPTRFLNLQPHGSMEALLSRAFSTQSKEKLLLPGYPISKAAVFFKAAASVYGFAGFTHISFITLMYIHIDLGAVYSILVNTNY